MKKNISIISLLSVFAILIAGAVIMISCEGPTGPAGPAGQDGQDGTDGINGVDGTDGTDGVAGNAVCMECHNLTVKAAVSAEYETSMHAAGGAVGRSTRNGCAACHSHEGFVETQWTGEDTTAVGIPIPQRIQCKTCHSFHNSLDFENEPNAAIRATEAVTLIAGGEEVAFFNDESNLCMNCHQSRTSPADDTDGSAITEVGGHYGPHHGPQANFINGLGGYEFGAALSTSGPHETMASCVFCHMLPGTEGGGHTWVPTIESCNACHPDATDFDVGGAVTEIEGLLADLAAALTTAGMLDAEGEAIEDVFYQADSVGALWNYILLLEDKSVGVHNPDYAVALLNNSLNVFQ